MAIKTIHEARFVLFDDDTRLAFITSFDGPWDAYMEDFFNSGPTLALFDVIFRHAEGYDGLPDLAAVKAFILGAQQTRGRVRPQLRRHGQGDPQGAARECGLPARARPPRRCGSASAPSAAAAARRSRGLTPMSDHISGPRALADPIADITDVYAFPSPERPGHLVLVMNTLPFAKVSNAALGGPHLPVPAATADGHRAGRSGAVRRPGRPRSSCSTACSPRRQTDAQPFEQEGTCTTPAGETVSFRVNDEDGGSGHGVRVFAGARWDPFILDAPAALKTVATGELAFTDPGSIYLDGKNVLGLVVEIDCRAPGGRDAGRRRRRDADARHVQRAHRARRATRGEEPDARPHAVRSGQPRPRDPRPVQHGGRVPHPATATRVHTGRG